MKKIAFFLIAACFISAAVSAQDMEGQYNGEVVFKGTPNVGTITITTTGLARNKELSIKNGIRNGFYALLFRGIPGSQYELPMIPNEAEGKNNPVVKSLLDGGYNSFLIDTKTVDHDVKKKRADGMKGMMTENTITINCDALRRYLEQNKVIRKFGI